MLSWSRRLWQDLPIAPRNTVIVAAALMLVLALGAVAALRPGGSSSTAVPEPSPGQSSIQTQLPTLALGSPERRRFPPREIAGASRSVTTGTRTGPESGRGWWFGTAGVALALIGWGSVAVRRYRPPGGGSGPVAMRVVGRTSLSPRHTVFLLDVRGRVLILGTGAQGAPTLLGELSDAAPITSRFDHRLGEES